MVPIIRISTNLWNETIKGLAEHSQGLRESGCIWAGKRNELTWTVKEVLFLDDLPGVRRQHLYHRTPRIAINKLFELLREKDLQIIADLHTHPTDWVELSDTDKLHPIEYRIGLIAVIFPYFAQMKHKFNDLGVHEYLGNGEWQRLPLSEVNKRIIIEEV